MMLFSEPYRILIVDDDPRHRRHTKIKVSDWGYQPFIAEGQGMALYQDAIDKALDYRCHAAIVDMRLWDNDDSEDKMGLELVKELSPVPCIIYTSFGSIPITVEAVTQKGARNLVSKTAPSSELRTAIEGILEQWKHRITIEPAERFQKLILDTLIDANIEREEIESVLSRLFIESSVVNIESISRSLKTPSSVHNKQSIVFRAYTDGEQPTLVKLSTHRDDLEREKSNYQKYIRGKLGGNFHPDLLNIWKGWNIGGVKYALIGVEGDVMPFSAHYKQCLYDGIAPDDAIKPLEFFFQKVWGPMLKKKFDETSTDDIIDLKNFSGAVTLFGLYNHLWRNVFTSDLLSQWKKRDEYLNLSSYSHKFINPFRWFADKRLEGPYNLDTYLVHGDLHGENLLVNTEYAWPIDFERTGPGHVLTDFVEIERNIIVRMAEVTNPRLFYEFVIVLLNAKTLTDELWNKNFNKGYAKIDFALNIISRHRKTAAQTTYVTDILEYYWALLMDCMYVLVKLSDTSSQIEIDQTTLLAGLLCKRLYDGISTEWPPSDYPPILILTEKNKNVVYTLPKIKILLFAANPLDTDTLFLDVECREIEMALRNSKYGNAFEIKSCWGTRVEDLQRELLQNRPSVVHFCGHGSEAGQIVLCNELNQPMPVDPSALGELFGVLSGIRCVILNACFSFNQAEKIAEHIEVVMGMSEEITDDAAIKFAAGLYTGIGFNENINTAYSLGCSRIQLANLKEEHKPQILFKSGTSGLMRFLESEE